MYVRSTKIVNKCWRSPKSISTFLKTLSANYEKNTNICNPLAIFFSSRYSERTNLVNNQNIRKPILLVLALFYDIVIMLLQTFENVTNICFQSLIYKNKNSFNFATIVNIL